MDGWDEQYSVSKSSSIKFLWHCVSKGAPMTCNLYATPLQLVAFELLRLVFTFIIFGWYQVFIFFVCLSKAKESGKKSRQPLNFCHKKDLRQSRDLDIKDFPHFFQCWADIDFRVECWATLGSVESWYRSFGRILFLAASVPFECPLLSIFSHSTGMNEISIGGIVWL